LPTVARGELPAEWRAPFVSIFADAGFVFAATAEGAILEGRATGVDRASGPVPKR
jgi:hypothetical protein